MEAKLIKTQEGYTLNDVEGNPIGQTFGKFKGKKLSLKNCQAIEDGYDLDELAKNIKTEDGFEHKQSFIEGAKTILEILGDKKFSEVDVKKAMDIAINYELKRDAQSYQEKIDFLKSLQQTEWDVEIQMEDSFTKNDEVYVDETNAKGNYSNHSKKPLLDANGCLILKRK